MPHDSGELALILSEHHVRKLSKNLTFKFECREHQLTGQGKGRCLRGAAVTVRKGFNGTGTVLREGRSLNFHVMAEGEAAIPVEDGKGVRDRMEEARVEQAARPAWKPAPDHPWRRGFKPSERDAA